jgi:small-conductance mechanosensitive channel/CRP-like cAMP-binding protein
MNALRRIAAPALLLAFFVGIALLRQDLLVQFGSEALDRTQRVFVYSLQIALWLAATFFVDRLIKVVVWDGIVAEALGTPVPKLVKDFGTVALFVLAVTGIIGIVFRQNITGIWATSGVIGLVVGLALQSIILDIFSGLALNFERSFRLRDWIQIHNRHIRDEITAEVTEVTWRTTRLLTKENNTLVVPNSILAQSVIMNYSLPDPVGRLTVECTLDFAIPSDRATRVLLAGVHGAFGGGILEDPSPSVRVGKVTALGVVYEAKFWIRANEVSPAKATDRVLQSCLEHLRIAGLSPAYPKEDIFQTQVPERRIDDRSLDGLAAVLGRVPLFLSLAKDERAELAGQVVTRTFPRGATLIQQGQEGQSMFVLLEGLLEVFGRGVEGKEIRVSRLAPGSFFGEMSLLTGDRRSATVKAETEVVVLEVTREHVARLLAVRPSLAAEISQAVAARRANSEALANAPVEKQEEHKASLADQILQKMRSFFSAAFRD